MAENIFMETDNHTIRYANFAKRLLAGMLDIILIIMVLSPLMGLIIKPPQPLQKLIMQHENHFITDDEFREQTLDYMMNQGGFSLMTTDSIYQIIIIAAITILFWHYKSATPGKMLLSLRIVDEKTLGVLSLKQQIIRYLGYFVSTIPLCFGFFWIAKSKKHQAWHDIMAGTLVIEEKKKPAV